MQVVPVNDQVPVEPWFADGFTGNSPTNAFPDAPGVWSNSIF